VTATTSTPGHREHVRANKRITFADGGDDYDHNIQIADLNMLNAAFAMIKWKKLYGVYAAVPPPGTSARIEAPAAQHGSLGEASAAVIARHAMSEPASGRLGHPERSRCLRPIWIRERADGTRTRQAATQR
jgi:hypothetical protein